MQTPALVVPSPIFELIAAGQLTRDQQNAVVVLARFGGFGERATDLDERDHRNAAAAWLYMEESADDPAAGLRSLRAILGDHAHAVEALLPAMRQERDEAAFIAAVRQLTPEGKRFVLTCARVVTNEATDEEKAGVEAAAGDPRHHGHRAARIALGRE